MPRRPSPTPEKHCAHCGAMMPRKLFNGRLEDLGVFKRRKFCGRACMASAMLQEEVTRSGYSQRARKGREVQCGECGTTVDLTVNHMNRDWSDNDSANLETLCMSCHMKKHWQEPGGLYERPAAKVCKACAAPGKRTWHGLCGKHWQRFKKYGDPMLTKSRAGGPVVKATD